MFEKKYEYLKVIMNLHHYYNNQFIVFIAYYELSHIEKTLS